jgi:hypothetical protein
MKNKITAFGYNSVLLVLLLFVLSGAGNFAAGQESEAGRLIFLKTFPGSSPEYTRVEVTENGSAIFQGGKIAEPEEPETFTLSPETTKELFRLAAALGYFRNLTLEFPKKIANMGEKTFVYEKGARHGEVKYNFTQNKSAQRLQTLFENIAIGRNLMGELAFRARFDRLGVAESLRKFDRALTEGQLVDLPEFVPVLARIEKDRRIMKLARNHAGRLIARLENSSARLQLEHGDTVANRYVSLVVREEGQGSFEQRRFQDKPQPQSMVFPAKFRARLWELAVQVAAQQEKSARASPGRFTGYRLTYEKGAAKKQLAFSSPPTAIVAEIVHILNTVVEQERLLAKLLTTKEKDRFMLQVVMQEVDTALKRNAVADPRVFVPVMEEIAGDEKRHKIERDLARGMLKRIRSAQPAGKLEIGSTEQ